MKNKNLQCKFRSEHRLFSFYAGNCNKLYFSYRCTKDGSSHSSSTSTQASSKLISANVYLILVILAVLYLTGVSIVQNI